jgi:hypothetical protein
VSGAGVQAQRPARRPGQARCHQNKLRWPPATNQTFPEYVSVFENLMPPKGRDPFFPNSHRRDPVPVMPVVTEKPPPSSELVLKGIVGAANHRLAVINNVILEVGESGTVRVPSGQRAREVHGDWRGFCCDQVEGEIQPKRLQLNKKGF